MIGFIRWLEISLLYYENISSQKENGMLEGGLNLGYLHLWQTSDMRDDDTDDLELESAPDEELMDLLPRLPATMTNELVVLERIPMERHPAAVYLSGLAAGSRRTMRQSLDRVAQMIMQDPEVDARTFNWPAIRYPHAKWLAGALARELSPATANKIIAALRGVLKEAWRLGLMTAEDYHRAIDVDRVKGTRLPPGRKLEHGEMTAFFQHCADDRSISAFLDAALFAAMVGGALRRSEVVELDLEDFEADQKVLRVLGKRNKEDDVPITEATTQAIGGWVNVRGFDPGPLFCPVRKGGKIEIRRMSDQAVYDRLRRRALAAGLKRFTPHDLRRTTATWLFDSGADASAIQRFLRHADVGTSVRYDRRGEEAKRKAVEMFHVPYVPFCR